MRRAFPRHSAERFILLTHYLLRGLFVVDTWLPYETNRRAVIKEWSALVPAVLGLPHAPPNCWPTPSLRRARAGRGPKPQARLRQGARAGAQIGPQVKSIIPFLFELAAGASASLYAKARVQKSAGVEETSSRGDDFMSPVRAGGGRMTLQQNSGRIQTTHIGSLPRPHHLLDRLKAKFAGQPFDEKAFEAELRQAVVDVVKKQKDCGIDIVTDGEFSKPGFFTYIQERLDRLRGAAEPEDADLPEGGRGVPGILRRIFQAGDDGRRDRGDDAGGLHRAR